MNDRREPVFVRRDGDKLQIDGLDSSCEINRIPQDPDTCLSRGPGLRGISSVQCVRKEESILQEEIQKAHEPVEYEFAKLHILHPDLFLVDGHNVFRAAPEAKGTSKKTPAKRAKEDEVVRALLKVKSPACFCESLRLLPCRDSVDAATKEEVT